MTVIETLKGLRDNADKLADEAYAEEDYHSFMYYEGQSTALNKAINVLIFGANEHE